MATASASIVLGHIRRFAATEQTAQLPDRELLQRFTTAHEQQAFAALVRRHGPLVFGVCRRVLGNWHDAEDAFQATSLVLARKAASISKRESIASWLYQVAFHAALKARARSRATGCHAFAVERDCTGTHRAPPRKHATQPDDDPLDELTARELLAVLDAELQQLPERYRSPLVLCYLEGQTCDQAAGQLGWSLRTLKRRLSGGKKLLRARLARRGVAVSAAMLAAALGRDATAATMPTALVRSAVSAALLAAGGKAGTAGGVSAAALVLADSAVKSMAVAKLKIVVALLLLLAAVGVGLGTAAQQAVVGSRSEAQDKQAQPTAKRAESSPAARSAQPSPPDDKRQMTVAGRVLDPNGKPVADAQVAVMAHISGRLENKDQASEREQRLGLTKTDSEGRFQLQVRHTSSLKEYQVHVIAAAADHGIGWQEFHADAEKPQLTVRLHSERVFRGRLVDLQGQPAGGIKVYLAYVAQKDAQRTEDSVGFQELHEKWSPWPAPVTTDKEGRFSISGLGRDLFIGFHVADDRFARQTLHRVETQDKEATLVLKPAQVVEGQVTYADTGKPVPRARLVVTGSDKKFGSPSFQHGTVAGRADDQGRFRISSYPGNTITANVYPPPGTAYLAMRKELPWPKGGATQQRFDIALERGVLVRGKIADQDGKPVAGAAIDYWPQRADNPNFRRDVPVNIGNGGVGGADGSCRSAVLAGPGNLLVQGGTPDSLQREVYYDYSSGRMVDSPGDDPNIVANGGRWRINGVAALNLKRGAEPVEIKITLRRGVTVKGRLVGPEGKSVTKAKMLCRLAVASTVGYSGLYPVDVRDGQFELPGCDPEKTYPIYFLDAKSQWGAMVEIAGKQASGEPVTVRLAPCGSATVSFLNRNGQPLAKYRPNQFGIQLLVGSGHKANAKGQEPEMVWLLSVDRLHYGEPLATDAAGRLTLPALIPGARYRISERGFEREFTVQSGDTRKLEDIQLPID